MPFWSWTRTTQEEGDSDYDESYSTSDDDAEEDDRINENYEEDGNDDEEDAADVVEKGTIRSAVESNEMNNSNEEILETQEFAALMQLPAEPLVSETKMALSTITILDGKNHRERIPSAISDDLEEGEQTDARPHPLPTADRQSSMEDLEDVPISQPVVLVKEEEDDATPNNLQDLYSLFLLAIEADRVDILQELLQSTHPLPGTRDLLINPVLPLDASVESPNDGCTSIPPLHIAISYGSMNAINFLLRSGANPALRPDVAWMMQQAAAEQSSVDQKDMSAPSSLFMLDVPHIQKYDQLTAWEMAFGPSRSASAEPELQKKSNWMFGNGSSSKKSKDYSALPPSKRESIRHAFLAEAIRAISNDDVERLQQLLDSGMPPGDETDPASSLRKWCTDFHAAKCLQYVQALLQLPNDDTQTQNDQVEDPTASSQPSLSARKLSLESGGSTLVALTNRHDELDALCRSLSQCLDNIAEEVSVGTGLLLQATGAQALASHVRTVKHQKEQLQDEHERYQDAYQNSMDELVYYIQQFCNQQGAKVRQPSADLDALGIHEWWSEYMGKKGSMPGIQASAVTSTSVPVADRPAEATEEEEEQKQRQQIITQIMMCENKIRLLRAAIADLSDENVRNLEEIERRGLMGGIDYIRTLRDEMREVEYQIFELKQLDVDCRTKIRTLQIHMNSPLSTNSSTQHTEHVPNADEEGLVAPKRENDTTASPPLECPMDDAAKEKVESSIIENVELIDSERIQQGHSTALVVHGPTRGFLSLNIWQILLRIMGISKSSHRQNDAVAASSLPPSSDRQSNGVGVSSARSVIII